MKRLIQFDWILNIKINSPLMILILIYPTYIIWMYKIARLGEKRLAQKANKLFLVLNGFLFIAMILILFQIPVFSNNTFLLHLFHIDKDRLINIIAALIGISWIYCSYYSMTITIQLDELRDEDYYPSITDKLVRFFQIMYWFFGIWVIQPKINEYYNEFEKA